jgi:hypothetical protein
VRSLESVWVEDSSMLRRARCACILVLQIVRLSGGGGPLTESQLGIERGYRNRRTKFSILIVWVIRLTWLTSIILYKLDSHSILQNRLC